MLTALRGLRLPPQVTHGVMASAAQGRQVTPAKLPAGVDPAAIGRAIGLSFTSGLHVALWVSGIMLIVGAPIAAATIRKTAPHHVRAAAAAWPLPVGVPSPSGVPQEINAASNRYEGCGETP